MTINLAKFQRWNNSVADILEESGNANGDHASLEKLLRALEQLLPCSGSMVILYPTNQAPSVPLHSFTDSQETDADFLRYTGGAYLLDPFYVHARQHQTKGLLNLSQVAPEGFTESEYYRSYYRGTQLRDEACFLIQADRGIGLISLCRNLGEDVFSADDIALLQSVVPVVEQVLLNWWKQQSSSATSDFHRQLENAQQLFATSVLTKRECDILNLMLHGHSTKSMANRCELSLETVKHYRKCIYTKLDINSQGELFHLFLDAIKNLRPGQDQDPLIDYLAPPT